jgi:hypothetical protein
LGVVAHIGLEDESMDDAVYADAIVELGEVVGSLVAAGDVETLKSLDAELAKVGSDIRRALAEHAKRERELTNARMDIRRYLSLGKENLAKIIAGEYGLDLEAIRQEMEATPKKEKSSTSTTTKPYLVTVLDVTTDTIKSQQSLRPNQTEFRRILDRFGISEADVPRLVEISTAYQNQFGQYKLTVEKVA